MIDIVCTYSSFIVVMLVLAPKEIYDLKELLEINMINLKVYIFNFNIMLIYVVGPR